jgi:hypothetical protein
MIEDMSGSEQESNMQVLGSMVEDRRAHKAAGCTGLTCMGEVSTEAFAAAINVDGTFPVRLVLTAVAVMADEQNRTEELERRLEVQRQMTADAAASAMRVDADLVDAHGQIAGLEQKVAALLAELTVMEEPE